MTKKVEKILVKDKNIKDLNDICDECKKIDDHKRRDIIKCFFINDFFIII